QDWFMYARMLVRSGDAAGALAACENGLARYPGDKHLDDLYQALKARA
ncbi:MAG: tetratricopeptide repeat protein, partial [Asticcacaulis sp.]|nr:tetratricopeptide repeat protein [Asticcacaulis sp.]